MADDTGINLHKERHGYTDSKHSDRERNPCELRIVENSGVFPKYKLVFKVTSSIGCPAGHNVGDQIIFDAMGSRLCKKSPEKICFGLLPPIKPIAESVMDKIRLGEDPTQMIFSRVHCVDVGADNGGLREVVIEAKVAKTQE